MSLLGALACLSLGGAAAYTTSAPRHSTVSPHQLWQNDLAQSTRHLAVRERAQCFHALQVAIRVHDGQNRRDGQPFVTHPVAVANLVANWGMDSECVVAALLHDAVEDTPLTFSEVEECFGPEVRALVQGVTRISKLDESKLAEIDAAPSPELADCTSGLFSSSSSSSSADDDKLHLFDACAGDWRVAVLKVADRLHNMRTLTAMAPHKRARKAQETERVFVPLAHYLGAHDVGRELARLSAQHRSDDQPQHRVWAERFSQRVADAIAAAAPDPPPMQEALAALGWPKGLRPAFARPEHEEDNFLALVRQLSANAAEPGRGAALYSSLRPLHERFTRHQAVLMDANRHAEGRQ